MVEYKTTVELDTERIINVYEGDYEGPLFITIGGVHGNEPAGILAMERLFKMIKVEPLQNPTFKFRGTFIGLKGNVAALEQKVRYINQDLNRVLLKERVEKALAAAIPENEEDKEIKELISTIRFFIKKYKPQKLVILDLHTTTAHGGVFSITSLKPESEKIAKGLYAPVVRGIINGLQGTSIHYFTTENMGVDTTTIVFESGQHDDPVSVEFAISGIINCMRAVGCVQPIDVEQRHDNLLVHYSKHFPRLVEIIYTHKITEEDQFVMRPGYKNFQPVQKNEVLAKDKNGEILCPADGMILMPLYQKQGADGFFLVKKIG